MSVKFIQIQNACQALSRFGGTCSLTVLTGPELKGKIEHLENLSLQERQNPLSKEQIELILNMSAFVIRGIDGLYERALEYKNAIESLTKDFAGDVKNEHLVRDMATAKLEGEAAGFDSSSRVVFVGSGPFPSTAMAYANIFNCHVACMDYDLGAALISHALIGHMGLSDKLDVVYQDGSQANYLSYTHVVIAGLVSNKNAVLEQIAKTLPSSGKVVCRTASGIRQLLYQPANITDTCWSIEATIQDPKNTFDSIVLTNKQWRNNYENSYYFWREI